jgi:hypothetical protein
MPERFELRVTAALPDSSGRLLVALGQVGLPEHQLAGLWILLTARHIEDSGYYNLEAFTEKPDSERLVAARTTNRALPKVTGFVLIEERPTWADSLPTDET